MKPKYLHLVYVLLLIFGVRVLQSQETSTVTDIDNNVYQTVKIGNQWWMAENLIVSKYRNGDPVPQVTDDSEWSRLTAGGWAYYENDSSNDDKYGKLYNWFAVDDSRGLCPEGWRIPDDKSWLTLVQYLGENAGGKMKATRTDPEPHPRWEFPNVNATNESGFSGLAGGYRFFGGDFSLIGDSGFWWSSSEDGPTRAAYHYLYAYNGKVDGATNVKQSGFSVRCLKDE